MAESFVKPDAATIERMSVLSIKTLIDTLKAQRAEKVRDIDAEISYYEELLAQKREEGRNA